MLKFNKFNKYDWITLLDYLNTSNVKVQPQYFQHLLQVYLS
ncbi:hypothetical protein HMPREF3213_00104 [Heyndrickxia coagulans]|uniref:Uncharacterized protein n=1 Tax=Heyndrickxia coagulans TaxID=1398 RepID=A0A133L2I1_HEYCO|nr:hypothetical protein HMPREF3213_00104 [Heyndrickxia coagulans]